jgi:hypothetical protein
MFHSHAPGPLLCTGIDLLFEPSLKLNPLHIFLDASRTTSLVIAWPGTCEEGKLTYAVPSHAHNRTWPTADLCDYCIVPIHNE